MEEGGKKYIRYVAGGHFFETGRPIDAVGKAT